MGSQFRIDTVRITTLWAEALQRDLEWNTWIAEVVAKDDVIIGANPDAFHPETGHPAFIKCLEWAGKEYPSKSEAYQMNQARLKFISDKVSSKINNISKKLARPDGSIPNKPSGYDVRFGVKKRGAAPLDWKQLGNLFHDDDYTPEPE
ncbi:MAG: hypothetical protein ACXACD_17805 [Candidatus Thorarchaeota archaeon]|jgi:hypothetical protein